MNKYRVYNNDKSDFFETNDEQLAYEVRKGSSSNCYDDDGFNREAYDFCERYSCGEDCTIEVNAEPEVIVHGDFIGVDLAKGDDTTVTQEVIVHGDGRTYTIDIESCESYRLDNGSVSTGFRLNEVVSDGRIYSMCSSDPVEEFKGIENTGDITGIIDDWQIDHLIRAFDKLGRIAIITGRMSVKLPLSNAYGNHLCKQPHARHCDCTNCRMGKFNQCSTFSPSKRRGK